jgi:5,10-methylenetetrahydromethanopterin reductase
MAISMRIGVGFNADLPVSEIAKYASSADELNFESFWMHEHSFGRDAVSYLSAASQVTNKIKIGVACLSPFVRHPVLLAMTVANLNEASNGRALLGIGTGFPMRLDLMGIKHEKPIAALKETIEICRGMWSGNAMTFDGKVFSVKNVKSLMGKSQKIPVYIAGWKKQMLRLTGKYADGYVAKGGESTVSIKQIVSEIKSAANVASRNLEEIDVAAYLLCLADKSKEAALERGKKDPFVIYMLSVQDDYLYEGTGIDPLKKKPIAENYFKGNLSEASSHITDEMMEAFTLLGTRDDVATRVREYQRAGINLPILQPISMKKEDVREVLEAGNTLIPKPN